MNFHHYSIQLLSLHLQIHTHYAQLHMRTDHV